jgi:dihydroorotate dehydrogenase electron transfer subunit
MGPEDPGDLKRAGARPIPGSSRILRNREVGPGWQVLRLEEPSIARAARPGRFVQVLCREGESTDPLLRRPFSVYDADPRAGTYDILYTPVGRGTRWMSDLPDAPSEASGRMVDVEGPFGNSFTPPEPGGIHYLVGGGVGVAPLYFLAREALAGPAARRGPAPSITLCMGARTRTQLQGIEDFRRLPLRAEVATDDGSEGFRGRVTDLFAALLDRERDPSSVRVYGCGPQGMNESLRAVVTARGIRSEICLESLMACAFGVCFGCVLPIRRHAGGGFLNRRVCWEGPVFDARLLHPGIEGEG